PSSPLFPRLLRVLRRIPTRRSSDLRSPAETIPSRWPSTASGVSRASPSCCGLTRSLCATNDRAAHDAREDRGVGDGEQGARNRTDRKSTSELQSRFDLVCRLLLEKK